MQDPYRVWFFTQTSGTHTGDFDFAGNVIAPTGGVIRNGTEANSVIWTADRQVKCAPPNQQLLSQQLQLV